MKAAFVVAPRTFEIREVPTPQITPSQMLVRIEACGVCSSDMTGYKDTWSDEMKQANPFPRRAGHEPAGTVVEVGRLVKGFQVGDRITGYFADDAYCEYVAVTHTFDAHRVTATSSRRSDGIPLSMPSDEPL
jgi:D-arabinose 1-dehydrogenase-like Zn-dependent alcohol dehydrogenase